MYHQKLINLQAQKAENNIGQKTLDYLKSLRQSLSLFKLIDQEEDLLPLEPLANEIRVSYSDVLILGTGGSSLGGQALYALASSSSPRLHFHDNIDPDTFTKLFASINPATTKVIAVSKSGNTAETLMQLLICIQHWHRDDLKIKDHFLIITEPGENAIREIAAHYHCKTLDHPTTIGGRFAVFTLVGLFPALISGLDVFKIRQGARRVLDEVRDSVEECKPLMGALLQKSLLAHHIDQTVIMPYGDRLAIFALWYRQLWAESLGKKGKGSTPIRAMGTVDQHSQLQLYLDGPKNKFFTVITVNHEKDCFKIQENSFTHPALTLFQGKTMGHLMHAEEQATIDTLVNNNCPTRVLSLDSINEEAMGELMMHYIIETLAMAYLLDVNPFDQPAVEEGKSLASHYLQQGYNK